MRLRNCQHEGLRDTVRVDVMQCLHAEIRQRHLVAPTVPRSWSPAPVLEVGGFGVTDDQ
ncbi:MAG: hypothetical protein IT319_11060 [Anaerolineae bacterium]|nr:hypothetical protein [Anaerolineae bacterium]